MSRANYLLVFIMLISAAVTYAQDQTPTPLPLQGWTYNVKSAKTLEKMEAFNAPDFKPESLNGDLKKAFEPSYSAAEGWRWLAVWVEFAQPKTVVGLPLAQVIAIDDADESYPVTAVDCEASGQQMLTWVHLKTMTKPQVMSKEEYKKRGEWEEVLAKVKQPDGGEDHLESIGLLCMKGWNIREQVATVLSGNGEKDRSLTLERQHGFIIPPYQGMLKVVDLDSYPSRSGTPEIQRANLVLLFTVKSTAKGFKLKVDTSSPIPLPFTP